METAPNTSTTSRDNDAIMTELEPQNIDPSVSFMIAETMARTVQASLESGISKLPFLSKQQELISTLNHIYLKNIDILERYLEKKVFCTTDDLPKKPIRHCDNHHNNTSNSSTNSVSKDQTRDLTSMMTFSSGNVSSQDMEHLKTTVEQLRTKKLHLIEKRQQCTTHVSCLQAATNLLSLQDTTLPATSFNHIQEHATLQDATRQGKQLFEHLSSENKDPQGSNGDDHDDSDMIELVPATTTANKTSTVEERFQTLEVRGNSKTFGNILKLLRE